MTGHEGRGQGGQGHHPLDPDHGFAAESSHPTARGPVVVGVSPSGLMVKPGSVYHLHVPVRPLNGEVDLQPLRRLAKSSNLLGTLLAIGGGALLIMAALFHVHVTLPMLAGFVIGAGVVTVVHGLIICGAPGTLATLLLGTLSLGFGAALVLGDFSSSNLGVILALWLTTKGLATLMLAVGTSVIATWPALLASGAVSLGLAGGLFWYRAAADLMLMSTLAGVDLLVSGLGFLLLACMAYAGMRMTEYESAGRDIAGGPYRPLSS